MRQPAQQAANPGPPDANAADSKADKTRAAAPGAVSAIHGLGERFDLNPLTGTAGFTVPIQISPGRSGFQPSVNLTYDSGFGNGPFGMGWSLELPRIYRRTRKGVPTYDDEGDVFVYSAADDLVPKLDAQGNHTATKDGSVIRSEYTPRRCTEPMRISRLTTRSVDNDTGTTSSTTSWQVITRDNITHVFGSDASSQIRDGAPGTAERIFAWLLDASFDSRGNAILYAYKPEDAAAVDLSSAHEQDRPPHARGANRLISRIRYGNTVPNRDPDTWLPFHPAKLSPPAEKSWLFEVVFDYGELPDTLTPSTARPDAVQDQEGGRGWACRADPFSSYRSGFEVRSYRLCRRILMFHHFPELGQQGPGRLVSSTDLAYDVDGGMTTLSSATEWGYVPHPDGRDLFLVESQPAVRFRYSRSLVPEQAASGHMELGPRFGDMPLEFVDLNGDGAPGILARGKNMWYFRPNRNAIATGGADGGGDGDGNGFMVRRDWVPVRELPAHILADGDLYDIEGGGLANLVRFGDDGGGYYPRQMQSSGDAWGNFRSFDKTLRLDNSESLLRGDLTGDGREDVFNLDAELILWAESLGEGGFSQPALSFVGTTEAEGPLLAAARDATQVVCMADIAGDGLPDLVRVRNGDVCYWSNLGYGRFGHRVVMDNAPFVDPELFSARRVRVADINGSGCADLVYFPPSGGVDVYLNLAGNRWSDAIHMDGVPPVDSVSSVAIVDLLGTGTQCLVWTSPGSDRLFYIDLMNGTFPYRLEGVQNGSGLETRFEYASSTVLMLEDEAAGAPWIRKLAHPVPCLVRVETADVLTGCTHVETRRYRHGHYDRHDREFRGFGMVETRSWDELASGPEAEPSMKTPVAVTKQWFSTGVFLGSEQATAENYHYYSRDFFDVGHPWLLQHAIKSRIVGMDAMAPEAVWEAVRTMTGTLVRTEEYMDDGTGTSTIPIRVTSHSSTVQKRQEHISALRPAVFSVHDRESLTVVVERAAGTDHRISQEIVIDVDEFFNIRQHLRVSYGRLPADSRSTSDSLPDDVSRAQQTAVVVLTHREFTGPVSTGTSFRAPVECQETKYQITDFIGPNGSVLDAEGLVGNVGFASGMQVVPYETDTFRQPPQDGPRIRPFSVRQRLFYDDDGQTQLPWGHTGLLALPSHTLTKAFTQSQLLPLYKGRLDDDIGRTLQSLGYQQLGDRHRDPDGDWWLPSPRQGFARADEEAGDLGRGPRSRFFVPLSQTDPFGNHTVTEYDSYSLFPAAVINPLGHATRTSYDYRTLRPSLVLDANGNRTLYTYDPLGDPDGVAMAGKADGEAGADSLSNFERFPQREALARFLADPMVEGPKLLGTATSRTLRGRQAYYASSVASGSAPAPTWTATITRQLPSGSPGASGGNYYIDIRYLDGRDRTWQRFSSAEADPTVTGSQKIRWCSDPWRVSTVSSGHQVKVYEPCFVGSPSPDVRPFGVPTTQLYDTLGRSIGTLNRDHTWSKTVFQPWAEVAFDRGDMSTVEDDPGEDVTIGAHLRGLCDASEYLPPWRLMDGRDEAQASQSRTYSDTPTTTHYGPGQQRLAVKRRLGSQGLISTHLSDVQGREREVVDARGVRVQHDVLDMAGNVVMRDTADKGRRRVLYDAMGRPAMEWDSLGSTYKYLYDELGRATGTLWREAASSSDMVIERRVYGDGAADGRERNMVGQLLETHDQSGVVRYTHRDLLYNPVRTEQQLRPGRDDGAWQDVGSERDLVVDLDKPVVTEWVFDRQGRVSSMAVLDEATVEYGLNERGLANTVVVRPAGQPSVVAIRGCSYDAWGNILRIAYGNGAVAEFTYDKLTLLLSTRSVTAAGAVLEKARYTYDAAGNIISIEEGTERPLSLRGAEKGSHRSFRYDALERLTEATGRELVMRSGGPVLAYREPDRLRTVPEDPKKGPGADYHLAEYRDTYAYDASDNLVSVKHASPSGDSWSRTLLYDTASNRLLTSTVRTDATPGPLSPASAKHYDFGYDGHGNITSGEGLSGLEWDRRGQLVAAAARSEDGKLAVVRFGYDAAGERTRRVAVAATSDSSSHSRGGAAEEDRRYYYANGLQTRTRRRRQLSIARSESSSESATTVTRTSSQLAVRLRPHLGAHDPVAFTLRRDYDGDDRGGSKTSLRYQVADHQWSVRLELEAGQDSDGAAAVVSREEFAAYGATTLLQQQQQQQQDGDEDGKTYRYTGKEKDDAIGLLYHGRRYYCPWLGRWASPDPIGLAGGGLNLYAYVGGNPVNYTDPEGTSEYRIQGWMALTKGQKWTGSRKAGASGTASGGAGGDDGDKGKGNGMPKGGEDAPEGAPPLTEEQAAELFMYFLALSVLAANLRANRAGAGPGPGAGGPKRGPGAGSGGVRKRRR